MKIRYFPYLDKTLSFLVTTSFALMIGVVVLQVVARYALPWAPNWTEELARFCFIYMVSLGAGLAIKEREYVSVDTLLEYLSPKAKKGLELLILALIVLLMTVMFFYSIPLVKIVQIRQSPAMGFTMSFMYLSMSAMGLFVSLYAGRQFLLRLKQG
ncbi:TRAP transporter small permease [Pleomorphovibrio marinus]|uniref:TRAP transporter small permease n=1 Tax=Pleomorphovibrio marinus TaxID=2164132 RepID=UPI000E0B41E1|nr:TRAP transporter small permease [Pleomorphovibrio marinus]